MAWVANPPRPTGTPPERGTSGGGGEEIDHLKLHSRKIPSGEGWPERSDGRGGSATYATRQSNDNNPLTYEIL